LQVPDNFAVLVYSFDKDKDFPTYEVSVQWIFVRAERLLLSPNCSTWFLKTRLNITVLLFAYNKVIGRQRNALF